MAKRKARDEDTDGATPVRIGGVGGGRLTLPQVVEVARHDAPVAVTPAAWQRVRACRAYIERAVAADHTVYGVTT